MFEDKYECIDEFSEIMWRDIGSHTNGNSHNSIEK